MSYDIYIGEFECNHTWNSASPLFHEHIDGGLQSLDGLTGKQAAQVMAKFWQSVNNERSKYWADGVPGEPDMSRKYDSPNGWGSLVSALIFAGEVTAACSTYPRHKVRLWT